MKRYLFAIVIMALMLPGATLAKKGNVTEVMAEGKAEVSADRTPEQAKALAIQRAERTALEEAVGTDIRSTTTVFNEDVINDMIVAGSKGIIIGREILEQSAVVEEGKIYQTVKIKVKIEALDKSLRSPYKVKLTVLRPGSRSSDSVTVFQAGDEAIIKVKLDNDGYVSIFSVDQNGRLYALYPNEYVENAMLEKGNEFVFPDDRLREMGLRLETSTLEGMSKSHESIVVVATKEPHKFLEEKETPELADLMGELAELGQENWAQATKGYVVMK